MKRKFVKQSFISEIKFYLLSIRKIIFGHLYSIPAPTMQKMRRNTKTAVQITTFICTNLIIRICVCVCVCVFVCGNPTEEEELNIKPYMFPDTLHLYTNMAIL